ncbi:PCC domain-containing protein [Prochlorococcus sp. MIT 1307]|uniref:PCC domain-containing protein n=1 Tax=Prochlorococcus sp. MIT 1307 TaxID=3096219 RepID=UPI002A752326|nr:DUF296 domain-containing protein [Prochlorococcus sp. MIT 1307]
MQTLPFNLPPGSDLRLSIEELATSQRMSGFVLSIVGNLSRACFQCPGRTNPTILEGNLEIITLNGTFSPNSVHLHLSISDGNCQVWGGHLENGSEVLKGADILVGFLERKQSDKDINSSLHSNPIHKLEVFVIPGCPWSNRAIRILQSNGIPHSVNTITEDEDFNLLKKRSGLSTFPQIFIDGVLLGGYESLSELQKTGKLIDLK